MNTKRDGDIASSDSLLVVFQLFDALVCLENLDVLCELSPENDRLSFTSEKRKQNRSCHHFDTSIQDASLFLAILIAHLDFDVIFTRVT